MENLNLDEIYQRLSQIKTNLIKKNQERRKGPDVLTKIEEAKTVYAKLNLEIKVINDLIEKKEISESEIVDFKNIVEKIKSLYNDIIEFGKAVGKINKELDRQQSTQITNTDINMTTFDLKVAVSLLPVMDNSEATTQTD